MASSRAERPNANGPRVGPVRMEELDWKAGAYDPEPTPSGYDGPLVLRANRPEADDGPPNPEGAGRPMSAQELQELLDRVGLRLKTDADTKAHGW